LALPLAFHGRPLTVLTGSMEPTLHPGDVVVAKRVPPLAARVGDVVTFRDPDRHGALVTHRVRSVRARGGWVDFVTKGDANTGVERWRVRRGGEIARAAYRVPLLGYGLQPFQRPLGLLLLVGIPGVLLGALELRDTLRPPRAEGRGGR
jgi:signal peptidase